MVKCHDYFSRFEIRPDIFLVKIFGQFAALISLLNNLRRVPRMLAWGASAEFKQLNFTRNIIGTSSKEGT